MSDPAGAPVVRFDAVWLGFDAPCLGPLTASVPLGARWVLQGANGTGKSLLLRALIDRRLVRKGRIEARTGVRPRLLAQEHPRPRPWPLSGADWFRATGAPLPDDGPVRDLLAQRLDRLSGGQWQLLRLAAALSPQADREPRLILLDEPTNHLDADVRTAALALLCGIADDDTVILASHDPMLPAHLGYAPIPLATLASHD